MAQRAPARSPLDALLDHPGPWTEEEFLALPEDRRIELLDGGLLVSPNARRGHQRLSSQLWATLGAAAPAGIEVLEAINVRIGPGRILIPDLAVVTDPGADDLVADASAVVLVVEIVSPGSVRTDRAVKPQLYAAAGIPVYLRIEFGADGPSGVLLELAGAGYREVARRQPGEPLVLTRPFPVELDLAALAVRTRPAG